VKNVMRGARFWVNAVLVREQDKVENSQRGDYALNALRMANATPTGQTVKVAAIYGPGLRWGSYR
jgi:hypothetical protein